VTRRWRLPAHVRGAAWMFGLLVALLASVLLFRCRAPPPEYCASAVIELRSDGSRQPLPLPLQRTPVPGDDTVLRFEVDFPQPSDPGLAAFYAGEAAPYVDVAVNGYPLTPTNDFGDRRTRRLAPWLLPIPGPVRAAGALRVELGLPAAIALSVVRLDQLCVGPYAELAPLYADNLFRQATLPRIALSLLAALSLFTLALARMWRRQPQLAWYFAYVMLAMCRVSYLAVDTKPGGPLLWRTVSDISVLALLWVLCQLIGSLWSIRIAWLERALRVLVLVGSVAMLATLRWSWYLDFPLLNRMVWLAVTVAGAGVALIVLRAARRAHPLEWRIVLTAMLFGAGCGGLELATFRLPLAERLVWCYPIGVTVVALAFGGLLLRRAGLGIGVLQRATLVLAQDLELALSDPHPAVAERIVAQLSDRAACNERQRMLRDLHDGFGSRLVGLLALVRERHPDSEFHRALQRALVDMRLVIDAIDESAATLDVALAMLRHRLQPLLAGVHLDSRWEFDALPALRIDDRSKLMQLFRCIEELVSNVIQHAGARRIELRACLVRGELVVEVADDGCGLAAQAGVGKGLGNVERRIALLGGRVRRGFGLEGRGLGVTLVVPAV